MEYAILKDVIQDGLEEHLKDHLKELADKENADDVENLEDKENLHAVLTQTKARVLHTIRHCMQGDDSSPEEPAPNVQDFEPLPLIPPVDDELLELQAKVKEISERIVRHRATVPQILKERLCEQLQACRPSDVACDVDEPVAGNSADSDATAMKTSEGGPGAPADGGSTEAQCKANDGADGGGAEALSPALETLTGKLSGAVPKMPSLRAKLEEALKRMGRVMATVESDDVRRSPTTVERAIGGRSGGGARTPGLPSATEPGEANTRRQLAVQRVPGQDVQFEHCDLRTVLAD